MRTIISSRTYGVATQLLRDGPSWNIARGILLPTFLSLGVDSLRLCSEESLLYSEGSMKSLKS